MTANSSDYTYAPFYAISGSGYGKGFTTREAVENFVKAVTRGLKVNDTPFKTKTEMVDHFTSGGGAPTEWKAPEGAVGFVLGVVPGHGRVPQWEAEDGTYTVCTEEQMVHNPHWTRTAPCWYRRRSSPATD